MRIGVHRRKVFIARSVHGRARINNDAFLESFKFSKFWSIKLGLTMKMQLTEPG